MADPWRCPECKTWIRADVTEHRCPPDDAVPAVTGTGGAGGPHPAAAVTVTGAPHHLWTSTTSSSTIPGVAVNIPA